MNISPRLGLHPRCKVEPFGLARKNTLIGIANRLSLAYEVRYDTNTTWLTTETDVIGVETHYVEELGIDTLNFFKPQFNNSYSNTTLVAAEATQADPVMEIERRYQEHGETSPLKADGIENALVPVTSPNQPIREISSKGVISDKLMNLMDSENVQKIDYSEIKEKGTLRQFSPMRHNKVVKVDKRSMGSQNTRKISPQMALRSCNRPMPRKKPSKSEGFNVNVNEETFSKTTAAPKENTITIYIDKKVQDNIQKCDMFSQTSSRNIDSNVNQAISNIKLKYPKTGKKRQSSEDRDQNIAKKALEEYFLQYGNSIETGLKSTQNSKMHINLIECREIVREYKITKNIKSLKLIRERYVKDKAFIDIIYVIYMYLVFLISSKKFKKRGILI